MPAVTPRMHDLRAHVLRYSELLRRHRANDPSLTDEERAEVHKGITAAEMQPIVNAIRNERRSAAPSKAANKRAAARSVKAAIADIDLDSYLPMPSPEGSK